MSNDSSAPFTELDAWHGTDTPGEVKFGKLPAKPIDPYDIDVKVLYCGLCASDVTLLSGAFGPTKDIVCGHEVIGEVTRVGPEVKDLKVGDHVGIGGQCDCCTTCAACERGDEHQCPQQTWTIGMAMGPFYRGAAKGRLGQGGFAKQWRGNERFAVKIPEGIELDSAGPLFCAGTTVFTPLRRHGAGTLRKRVGVIGLGGLGHLGIQIANAMGAEVTAISRGSAKEADARKLGAKHYIATGSDLKKDFEPYQGSLDLIISTIDPPGELEVNAYLSLLGKGGLFVPLGVVQKPLQVDPIDLIMNQKGIVGSAIGAPQDIRALLKLCAEKGVKPWTSKYNFDDITEAMAEFKKGVPRYRFVLVNTDNGGKM